MSVLNRNNLIMLLPWLAFTSLISILPLAFLYEKGGRVIFYYCAYFSLTGLVVDFFRKKKILLTDLKALAMLMLGAIFIGWSLYAKYLHGEKGELYFTAGKRCVLAFIIMTYIFHVYREKYLGQSFLIKSCILSLALAFLTSSSFAFIQALTSDERVVLGINRATLTAYAYSAVTLALIALILHSLENKYKKFYFLSISIISLYVIMLTQTRSAMVIHTLFLLYMTFRLFAVTRNIKFISLVSVLMLIAVGLSYKVIETRFDTTVQEYRDYEHGNDKTSLGSRFTMWKMGVLTFEKSPFGQSQVERNNYITTYLDAHNQKDSWALIYINVHLHNEFIQYASLFGVQGVLVLFYFFYIFIIAELRVKKKLTPIAAASIATLLYGMTDVVLTSIEFIAMFSVLVTLLTLIEKNEKLR
ncbi:O-antigen ligase family protein [Pantoea sp. DY-15]|uniref:O-antigen ligase family protein n=1 Tax=unclassified Pantoea TaxID=2630326 RepID=UPI001C9449D6|nr:MULTISPECIES: O-antigen ligase family protein [unclassified Pantoea]MBY4839060.1 O-antigen ligase family protein [Pantoea sp. DY-5]MBY4889441.1 O-antigen ligase family protein [Pantoea sp. DY-15]